VSASDDLELFASNSIRVVSSGRHCSVGVGWPSKNRVGTSRRGIAQTYGRWEKKNESKGGGKWNTGVVIGAGEACDGSGVAGDRQRQLLVQLEVHWCSRRSLENVLLALSRMKLAMRGLPFREETVQGSMAGKLFGNHTFHDLGQECKI